MLEENVQLLLHKNSFVEYNATYLENMFQILVKVLLILFFRVPVYGVISCQVKQHMHLMFLIWLNFSIYIGLHMSSHFPILYVHNLNGCRITQH